jgi:hypothetical protein
MANRRDVYTVVTKDGQKPFWVKIGTAFVNKDDSINPKSSVGQVLSSEPAALFCPKLLRVFFVR